MIYPSDKFLRPRNRHELTEYYERCRVGLEQIYSKHGIEKPRCGSGIGLGWLPIFERAVERLVAAGWTKGLGQVKQKFCRLVIYIDEPTHDWSVKPPVTNELGKIIEDAAKEADAVCEICGREREKKGMRGGWALCNSCSEVDGPTT